MGGVAFEDRRIAIMSAENAKKLLLETLKVDIRKIQEYWNIQKAKYREKQ